MLHRKSSLKETSHEKMVNIIGIINDKLQVAKKNQLLDDSNAIVPENPPKTGH